MVTLMKATATLLIVQYLDFLLIDLQHGSKIFNTSVLTDGDKHFVEKGFHVITLDTVHDKSLQRRHNNVVLAGNYDGQIHKFLGKKICAEELECTTA